MWLIFPSVTHFSKKTGQTWKKWNNFEEMGHTWKKGNTSKSGWPISSSVAHFSKGDLFFQVWPIFPSVTHFFQVWPIFLSVLIFSKNGSHLKKWVTLKTKKDIFPSVTHFSKSDHMGHAWRNEWHLRERVTLGKNGTNLKKWVTLEKRKHFKKWVTHFFKCGPFFQGWPIFSSVTHFSKRDPFF